MLERSEAQWKSEMNRLKYEIYEEKKGNNALQAENNKFSNEVMCLKRELEAGRKGNDVLQARNNEIQNEVMCLTREVEAVRKELVGEKRKTFNLEGKISDLEAELKMWERKESERKEIMQKEKMEAERKQRMKMAIWERMELEESVREEFLVGRKTKRRSVNHDL